MTLDEKLEIAKKLQEYHYFFRCFWDIGSPTVVDDSVCNTAAIEFDKEGNALRFLQNEKFWNSLNEDSKMFVICHEMLHIILNHGIRFKEHLGTPDAKKMNYAADVVINEMLVSSFGFTRSFLDPRIGEDGCWLNTVFKEVPNIKSDESTEYYFANIPDDPKDRFQFDEHIMQGDDGDGEDDLEGAFNEFINESGILDKMSGDFLGKIPKAEKQDAFKDECDNPFAGSGKGGNRFGVNAKFLKKSKWESVVKKWELKFVKETIDQTERWERISPRYSHVISDEISLPSNIYVFDEHKEKEKIEVYFFLDTSGSCIGLKDRFYTAARSLNPKKFNVRLFNFDTSVYDVDIKKNEVYGGGGTCFNIIENKIQSIIKTEKVPYPKAVWIVTDGYGTNVRPERPQNWHWFLTPHSSTGNIPQKSKVYNLKDYE